MYYRVALPTQGLGTSSTEKAPSILRSSLSGAGSASNAAGHISSTKPLLVSGETAGAGREPLQSSNLFRRCGIRRGVVKPPTAPSVEVWQRPRYCCLQK